MFMLTFQRIGRIFGVMGLVISVMACSQEGSPISPSSDLSPSSSQSPSPSPTAPPPSFDTLPRRGATIQGTVSNVSAPSRFTGLTTTITVKVVGTDITAPVSPSGAFVLEGVPSGDIKLEFTGGATTLIGNVNTGDRIDIQVRISGSKGVVDAAVQIRSDSTTFVDGTVTSVSGSCPNRTIVVNDWTLTLTNSSQGACPDVRVGMKVKIKGSFTSSKTIIIVKIEVQGSKTKSDDKDSDDDDSDDGDSDSDRRRRVLRALRQLNAYW